MIRTSIHYIAKALSVFSRNENGATAVEYGLFVALIAAVIVTIVGSLGATVHTDFQTVCKGMNNGTACTG